MNTRRKSAPFPDAVSSDPGAVPRLSTFQLIGKLRDARFPGRMIVHAQTTTDDDMTLYRRMGGAVVMKSADPERLLGTVKAFHRQD